MAVAAAPAVAVGAELAAKSAERSPISAPLAPTDPPTLEVAADAAVTMNATAVPVEVGGALCSFVALV